MKRAITLFLLTTSLVCCSLLFHSCTKTPDEPEPEPTPAPCTNCLPPITTEGKGTFGCKVNGKVWLPKGVWGNPSTGLSYYNKELGIFGYNDDREERVGFAFATIMDTGYYDFSIVSFDISRVGFSPNLNQADRFRSEPATFGYFHLLRFEPTTTGIVSGEFAFDAYNTNGDTIHITEGRFDLHF